ncbi:MAG TPA: MmgE/PrpD family protein [Thermoanaerobaculia bacterium]|nr:MmgE/PrpD family protein [Thermoanaerobaculia bacterium]
MLGSTLQTLAKWGASLTLDEVPPRVREAAIDQVLSTLGAMLSGRASDLGEPLARMLHGDGVTHDAMRMAAWSMVLDYDDVMLGGHTGHSAVLVPLALARGHSGNDLLLAQIVANEIAARINMVCAVGTTRGQMATHVHLLAAAAARAKLEALPADSFAQALALAMSYPAAALFPSFLGSDAKMLCAAWPVRMGMEAVDAVRAGLVAAADPVDDRRGFFAVNAKVPVREFLGGLGTRWHTETNSFKLHPVCGYLSSAVEATLALVHEHDLRADDVASIDVWASIFTVGMDGHSSPYLEGRRIATLTFSTPFVLASCVLARDFTPRQLRREWIEEPRVWELAARIRSRHDVGLTLTALTADIPIGAALRRTKRWQAAGFGWHLATQAFGRGGRWKQWRDSLRLVTGLARVAGETKPLDFTNATKPMGARVSIRLRDGREVERSVSIPRGFAGHDEPVRPLLRRKFVDAAIETMPAERACDAAAMIEEMESLANAWSIRDALDGASLPLQRFA